MSFYKNINQESKDKFKQVIKDIRVNKGIEYQVPVDMNQLLLERIKEYSRLYNLVHHFFILRRDCKIIVESDVTRAEYLKSGEEVNSQDLEVQLTFSTEGNPKLIKVIYADNYFLDQDIEEYDEFIFDRLAKSIAMGIDNAILNGRGEEYNEPQGILKFMDEENKNISAVSNSLESMLLPLTRIDSGIDNDNEIIAIVNRNTYLSTILKFMVMCPNPSALPRFITCHAMPDNKILYADFSKYLGVRKGDITMESSKHDKFIYDKTGFKSKIVINGFVTRKKAFAEVSLVEM